MQKPEDQLQQLQRQRDAAMSMISEQRMTSAVVGEKTHYDPALLEYIQTHSHHELMNEVSANLEKAGSTSEDSLERAKTLMQESYVQTTALFSELKRECKGAIYKGVGHALDFFGMEAHEPNTAQWDSRKTKEALGKIHSSLDRVETTFAEYHSNSVVKVERSAHSQMSLSQSVASSFHPKPLSTPTMTFGSTLFAHPSQGVNKSFLGVGRT